MSQMWIALSLRERYAARALVPVLGALALCGVLMLAACGQPGAVPEGPAPTSLAKADPMIEAVQPTAKGVRVIARIQRQLHGAGGERASFNRFAQDLLTDAIAAAGAAEVSLEIEGGEEPLHEDQATPVSLVLLECVNNALEHAFAAGATGRVSVSLTRDGRRHVLTVADDGGGLPEGFDPKGGRSLGLKIVRTMATQLGGDFSMAAQEPGVVCRLRFPALET